MLAGQLHELIVLLQIWYDLAYFANAIRRYEGLLDYPARHLSAIRAETDPGLIDKGSGCL